MEENEVVEQEVEVTESDADAFDEGMDDDDGSEWLFDDHDDDADEPEELEPTDEPENIEEDEPEESEDADEATEEQGKESKEGNQLFEITYLGNKEQLTLEQMTELAQKGRDYDHVREERDSLKDSTGRQLAFLKKLADKAGVSVDEQIDLTEAMWLMDEEADKGNRLTESEALLRVQRERNKKPDEGSSGKPPDDSETDEIIARFLKEYPDVTADQIPQEVWDDAHARGDLLTAYQAWQIRELKKASDQKKRSDLNNKNEQRSTGPRKSAGANRKKDDFDEGWDS